MTFVSSRLVLVIFMGYTICWKLAENGPEKSWNLSNTRNRRIIAFVVDYSTVHSKRSMVFIIYVYVKITLFFLSETLVLGRGTPEFLSQNTEIFHQKWLFFRKEKWCNLDVRISWIVVPVLLNQGLRIELLWEHLILLLTFDIICFLVQYLNTN